jgi:hypothetical protein
MIQRLVRTLLLAMMGGAAVGFMPACAYNATGVAAPRTMVFEYSLQQGGTIIQSPNIAYYFVLNGSANPAEVPVVNGPVPQSRPYPNPLSYLPFVRDDRKDFTLDITDNTQLPTSYWTTYFALYQEAGQEVMWQGILQSDGTVNERFHQLQSGREWGIQGGTVQITLPLNQFLAKDLDDPNFVLPAQIEANLAVAIRGQAQVWYQIPIKRWGQVPNSSFNIPTATGDQTVYDQLSGVTFANNLQGNDPRNVNIVSYHYRITLPQ